jgi:uncharacterized protein (DUF305 family)
MPNLSWPPASWPRALALAVAVGFLGFAVATFVQRDDDEPPSEDSVDVGFLQDMDYHHDQAVVMADMELTDGEESEVLHLAREIMSLQSYEMGVMQRTLEDWGYSIFERSPDAMEWMGMPPVPVEQMQGLQTEEKMTELEDAEGAESDALFMEMMVDHHVGGLHMAEYAAGNAETDVVRDLAAKMAVNQAKEINVYAGVAERLDLPVEIERVEVPDLDV